MKKSGHLTPSEFIFCFNQPSEAEAGATRERRGNIKMRKTFSMFLDEGDSLVVAGPVDVETTPGEVWRKLRLHLYTDGILVSPVFISRSLCLV